MLRLCLLTEIIQPQAIGSRVDQTLVDHSKWQVCVLRAIASINISLRSIITNSHNARADGSFSSQAHLEISQSRATNAERILEIIARGACAIDVGDIEFIAADIDEGFGSSLVNYFVLETAKVKDGETTYIRHWDIRHPAL